MKQHAFESAHQNFWQQFEQQLQQLEQKHQPSSKEALVFGQQYRTVCHHLALAHSRDYSARLCQMLQKLVDRGHRQLYQHKTSFAIQLKNFVQHTFPQTCRAEKTAILWGHLLFYVPFWLCFVASLLNPSWFDQLAGIGAGNQMANAYSQMAQLQSEGQSRPWGQNWMMLGYYIFNNIGIGFQSFVGGIVLGLGSIYVAVYNGAILGSAMGFMASDPAGPVFFSFVGAHGAFELTGIVLSVAGGLKLGFALIHPGQYTRKDALKIQGKPAAMLIGGAFLMLFIAAFIEAFWSPITLLPLWLKYTVAIILWLSVYAYLLVYPRKLERRPE